MTEPAVNHSAVPETSRTIQPRRLPVLLAAAAVLAWLAAPAVVRADLLHSFGSIANDGIQPFGSVTLSGAKLYGMTLSGGGSLNDGAIFSVNTDGTNYGLLHSFTNATTDGRAPDGALTISGTTMYGMTQFGGTASSNGSGTLFKINTDGTGFGLLHSFLGGASDGSHPTGSLTLSGTKLYGMTGNGGNAGTPATGTIFSMNTDGTGFGLLHNFGNNATDGGIPAGSLTLSGGKFYGMTKNGGSDTTGTIFSLNLDGSAYSVLHHFTGSAADGKSPYGQLTIIGTKAYGMTPTGGANSVGAVFSMNTDGTGFTLIHSFSGAGTDSAFAYGSLTLAGTKLYGMGSGGGTAGSGAIFSMNTDGTGFNVVKSFLGGTTDGANPQYADLTLSGDGSTLFGMALNGGSASQGVIFSQSIVPEPTSAALLGLGAALLATRRRRRE